MIRARIRPIDLTNGIIQTGVVVLGASLAVLGSQVSSAASSAPAVTAACQKVTTEAVNADKVYIALQLGVVKAAQDYVADENLTNRLNYNQSYIRAITAANVELNFFIKNPKCYTAANLAAAKKEIKTNLAAINTIYTDNVNGQVVGDPKKMTTYKPVGLLK